MMGGFGMGYWGGLGMLFGGVFWIALVALVVWAVASLTRRTEAGGQAEDTALEILKRRYARGEISQAEYEVARKDLQ